MQEQIKQVLQLFMLLGKQSQGGILVLFWVESGAANCAVAAAGPKWRGVRMEALQSVLADLKFLGSGHVAGPDPEELCAFTDVHGCLRLLLSFQVKDMRSFTPEWLARIKAFLHTFSLANAETRVHLRCNVPQQSIQQEFRATFTRKVKLAEQHSLMLDVTCRSNANKLGGKRGVWCHGGHPVLGSRLPLSIPPEAMDRGLYGELSTQLVTLLSPCLLQYPNLEARLTHVQISFPGHIISHESHTKQCSLTRGQVLAYSPANVPITSPLPFLRNLPAHLDCQEEGLRVLSSPSYTEPSHDGSVVYTVDQETSQTPKEKLHSHPIEQKLLVFLFLQHTDPFASHLSDFVVTEVLIERHLEEILNNNRRAITATLQEETKRSCFQLLRSFLAPPSTS
ncbi:DUF4554 domain-containing protein [Dunckerocampus dactyliophorus]|uniref:DUF4554 domain-containing protein n=1 Tax=Dunckerocampus dactyliophorus TaxID=161453 RepID=UPI002405708D|nr:DUF4554 domain-containing protein [Dunckerocampus dactyliophorus]